MPDLLNPDVAIARILEHIHPLGVEQIPLGAAYDRILAETITASLNIPPFANSSMDGFAVRAADVAHASKDSATRLKLVMDIAAGSVAARPLSAGEAARIMTGAPMPEGADAVVPVEATDHHFLAGDTSALPDSVGIFNAVRPGSSVRAAGEDIVAGQTVLTAGTRLRPQEVGVLAALGIAQVPVVRRPRVAILSTGDELVEVDQPLQAGQIRDVNAYTLAGLVALYGGEALHVPTARDTLEDVRLRFGEALALTPDLILSSAGVSVGAFDVVRAVLAELGQVDFWRVNIRPGKPLAYGYLGADHIPFFGLPGNPVSAMVTFDVFVRPTLLKMSQRTDALPTIIATLEEPLQNDGRRSYFRVKLHHDDGIWYAKLTGTQSSGALLSMVLADGLVIAPEDTYEIAAGTPLPVRVLKDYILFTS